jgi:glycosyltransferase involved in cell wall biosynthesis
MKRFPQTHSGHGAGETTSRPLEGSRICLVFDFGLSHYSRLLLEIDALQRAGAQVRLLTPNPAADAPPGVETVLSPLGPNEGLIKSIGWSTLGWSPLRRASNTLRKKARHFLERASRRVNAMRYSRKLRGIAESVDIIWVIDFPRLGQVLRAASRRRARVVYETVDLVPEYMYEGEDHRRKCLDEERSLIGCIDGFITACDSYADYYVERYGNAGLHRRPIVRDNMPSEIAVHIKATTSPLRLLFFGSLLSDRPVLELIEAIATTTTNVTLTFQGRNHLKEDASHLIADRVTQLGLQDRVEFLAPCPPDSIVETVSAYDVGVVALRGADENERRASTAKLFTYMAAGLAVLGSDLPGIARIVRAHDNGLLVDGMNPHAWAAAIDRLASMPTGDLDSTKERSLGTANLYAWERQESAYVAEFVRALSSQARCRPE